MAYQRCRWVVNKEGEEYILSIESRLEGEEESTFKEVLRSKYEIVVLPVSKMYSNWEDFSAGFLMRDKDDLWELNLPRYITTACCPELESYHTVETNIINYEVQDSFILYRVLDGDKKWWKCFSIAPPQAITAIFNDYLEDKDKNLALIAKRAENIPGILAEEVHFDKRIRNMRDERAIDFQRYCYLSIRDGMTVVVSHFETVLSDDRIDLTYTLLPGIVKHFYDQFVVIDAEKDNVLCSKNLIRREDFNQRYSKIVSIKDVLKEDTDSNYIPDAGIAMLNKENKIVKVDCHIKGSISRFVDAEIFKEFTNINAVSFKILKNSYFRTRVKITCWDNDTKVISIDKEL